MDSPLQNPAPNPLGAGSPHAPKYKRDDVGIVPHLVSEVFCDADTADSQRNSRAAQDGSMRNAEPFCGSCKFLRELQRVCRDLNPFVHLETLPNVLM